MSGSGSSRGDSFGSGIGGVAVSTDACEKVRHGPINSPKAPVLSTLAKGSVLDVVVRTVGNTPILVVQHNGLDAGSLTFVGYLEIIECIQNRGYSYAAEITDIVGGIYEVEVAPR